MGEFIHDLRSALEHVAWVLAASNTDDIDALWKPGARKRITFPVVEKRERFANHSLLTFISDDAKAVLYRLQPCQRGHPVQAAKHPLAMLHDLWNVDKHSVVHGGVGGIDLSTTSWRPKAIRIEELSQRIEVEMVELTGPLEDGAAIAYVRFPAVANPPGTTKVDVKGEPTARVLFGSGGLVVSVEVLESFCTYVAAVLNAVRPLFPAV